ncbi:CGNR zinc finger domain-containing protein [Nocardia asteroides]|uniref:CGNR zinc finger domain-containing protein n=1 Tax=Nocardia asteroides TaxID=1824 RepID=UPI001E4B4327|nr:CGNR zinc finger domain-containing protein [Nocardia asteroides]UGT57258.1 CGNR zinc finger domain-containing protein [Nocardia asteroides]
MSALEPLVGEHLAIDLVNTRPAGADLVGTAEQLAQWLRLQEHRLPETFAEPGEAEVRAVQEVRDHVAAALTALRHGERPPGAALRGLAAALSAAPAVRHLAWDGARCVTRTRREGTASARLAAVLADAAVDLLTDPAVDRLRQCAAEDCVMLFVPAHPRRQWCSPERCGNRARVARYYQRHK